MLLFSTKHKIEGLISLPHCFLFSLKSVEDTTDMVHFTLVILRVRLNV